MAVSQGCSYSDPTADSDSFKLQAKVTTQKRLLMVI